MINGIISQIKLIILGLIFCCLFNFQYAAAAACCARNSAVPVLIVGEDEAQFNFGMSLGAVVAEVCDEGIPVFGSPETSEINQLYRLEGALLLSDRFQVGMSLNGVNHRITKPARTDSQLGIGDTRISLGYEYLPSWTYSSWKPQGFLFSVLTFPTGRSSYEFESLTAADVTGNGFYSVSIGSLLIKRWTVWDVFMVPEVHYSLPRTFKIGEVEPGFGGSIGFGVGMSPWEGNFRLGLRVQPRVDQSRYIAFRNSDLSRGILANCDTGLDIAYLVTSNDTLMISYIDQTLLGPAINSNLSRVFGLNFQHRWER